MKNNLFFVYLCWIWFQVFLDFRYHLFCLSIINDNWAVWGEIFLSFLILRSCMKPGRTTVQDRNWAYILHVKNGHLYLPILEDQKKEQLMKVKDYVKS
jgi:hypothetical protein